MTFLRSFAFLVLPLLCVNLSRAQTPTDITSQLTFTTIDVPGAGVTGVQGINKAGDMIGVYGATNVSPAHAFMLSGGVFTYLDYPGAYATFGNDINDSGLIVGYAEFQGGTTARGFTYNGTNFTSFRDGNNSATFGMAINNAGVIVGGAGSIYTTKGFELIGGQFKGVSPPGTYVYVYATGINSLGKVVGWTVGDTESGYAYNHGQYYTIAYPAAVKTQAHSINDSGLIVGWYAATGGPTCGFVLKNGKYNSYGYPGAVGTFPSGINALGEIVGSYTFDYTTYHGFVTSPLTPADFD